MKVVLDASAGLSAVLGQESGPAILDVLAGATVVSAPELFAAEVTSGPSAFAIMRSHSPTIR